MKHFLKRFTAVLSSGVMAAGLVSAMPISLADAAEEEIIYLHEECENLTLEDGMEVWTSIYNTPVPGYSGDGFIYLTSGSITATVEVPEDGMYEITTSYAQILNQDGREQTLSVNGAKTLYRVPYADSFQEYSFGVHRLKAGENTIQLLPQYGYACFDTLTVKSANLPALDTEPTLVDKEATPETQGLMNYLTTVYGDNALLGQQEIYGGGNDGDYELEFDFIYDLTGEYPSIRGFDMMNYNPLYGWDDNTTERMIEWTNEKNGICTLCWHINVPKDFASYTPGDAVDWTACTYKPDETDFDTANAVVEGTKEYEYFMMAVEDLAEQLLRLQEAGVPVIFRPLHEAEGNPPDEDGSSNAWFWWGKSGADVYVDLWKLLYTELTETYGVHNLIWEYNSYTYNSSPAWYPGDEYVDIVAYDKYNRTYNRTDGLSNCPNEDAISGIFYNLVDLTDNKKMVAMSENDTIPSLENLLIEKAGWLYFCPWYGEHILDETYNDPETLKVLYQSDYMITLDELPADWKNYQGDSKPVDPTDPEIILGDVDENGKINTVDVILLKQYICRTEDYVLYEEAWDWNEDGEITVHDVVGLTKYIIRASE